MTDTVVKRTVECGACTGEVLDDGALVLAWRPTGAAPVVFAHPVLDVRPGKAPHAGIPICWPWFGPGRRPGMSPQHGFVRDHQWDLVERVDGRDSVTLHHRITSEHATSPHFRYPYALDLRTRMGATLELELTTTNTGSESFDLEEALHCYLAVGDVRHVRLEGLDGSQYFDKTTRRTERQDGELAITGETDRVYRSDHPVTVVDHLLDRRLRVTTEGAANRVVWNPWAEEAAKLDDVRDEWTKFVCVEGGNVLDDAITVAPGRSRSLTYRVEVFPR